MGVRACFGSLFLLFLLCAGSAPAVELFSGVTRQILLPERSEETLFADFTFTAPPGARWVVVEATTGSTELDVDLFLRFGGPVDRLTSGAIRSSASSETPAGVDEHIFLNELSTPKLETGVYHLALLSKSLNVDIPVTLKVTVELGGEQRSFLLSAFDDGRLDGWTRNFPPTTEPGATNGDAETNLALPPEGTLRVADFNGPARDALLAAPKFLGDLASFSDARFEYEFRYVDGPAPLFPIEMRIIGAGGAYRWLGPRPKLGEWMQLTVPLEAGEWSRVAGTAAFLDVLRNVTRIEISMDHSLGGDEINEIDNFQFRGEPPPPVTGGGGGPTHSDFETGLDGWTRNYPASAIPGASIGAENSAVQRGIGGRNSDGVLLMIDGDGRDQDWAIAPPKFVAGLASLDRPWFEFYYRRLDGDTPFHGVRLRLVGGGSTYQWTGARPRDTWERFRVPISADNWVLFTGTDSFDHVVRNVQRLEVSFDLAFGPEVNALDDFHLRTQFSSPSGPGLSVGPGEIAATVFGEEAAEPVTLAITSTGGEMLAWSATVDPPVTWIALSTRSGETDGETVVTLNPNLAGAGVHQAEIVVESSRFGVLDVRVPVRLSVGPSIGGVMHAADPGVALSPGALASLYGRFLSAAATQATLDGGRLPSSLLGTEVKFFTTSGDFLARAPLLMLSEGQINLQVPYEVAALDTVLVAVCRAELESPRFPVPLSSAGPGIFNLGNGRASVVNPDGSVNGPDNPARTSDVVTVFFSGSGAVSPPLETGRAAAASPLHIPIAVASAEIGGVAARVLGSALSPGFVGLAQLGVEISPQLPAGVHPLVIRMGEARSNSVTIWVFAPPRPSE